MQDENANALIVGLGLIGGSMAAAIKTSIPNWNVLGFDINSHEADTCLKRGFLHRVIQASELADEIQEADLIVLATPITEILNFLEEYRLRIKQNALILDVGSTKRQIVEAMNKLPHFVNCIGGHPMTGKNTAGVDGPDASLFEGRVFILSKTENTTEEAFLAAIDLVKTVGGVPLTIPPEQHDDLVAMASHLPYLIPVLLIKAANEAKDELLWQVAAGGFKSIVGNAAHNIPMWEDILYTNNKSIIQSLEIFEQEISTIKALLDEPSKNALRDYLKTAAELRQKL